MACCRLGLDELRGISGVGSARAARVLAAVELGRRALAGEAGTRPQFRSPADLGHYLMPLYGGHRVERFGVLLLDTRLRLIRTSILATGSADGVVVEPRDVYREALAGLGDGRGGVPQPPVRRPDAEQRRSTGDRAAGAGRTDAGHHAGGPHHPRRGPLLQLQGGERTDVKTLYFDCFAGAAGDMILGALIDAGVPFDEVQRALGSLAVDGVSVSVERVLKTGVSSLKFRVHEHAAATADSARPTPDKGHRHYHLKHIYAAIEKAASNRPAKARATRMFERLAEAEAAVHHSTLDKVHLHEVGAIDSIIDIVGSAFAMDYLGADRVVVSPVNVGGGMVKTAHGVFPVPAPATVRVAGRRFPPTASGVQLEMLTPTGALILSEYATDVGPMPAMRVSRVGYGAGDRELAETPNVVGCSWASRTSRRQRCALSCWRARSTT